MQDYFTLELSFSSGNCNGWPLISVEGNGQILWCDYIESQAVVKVNVPIHEHNCILIRLLNKQDGPDVWDTMLDENSKIVADKFCILTNIMLARSRCDFLILDLDYHLESNEKVPDRVLGFMGKNGFFKIEFPRDVYGWISRCKKQKTLTPERAASSRGYFFNYLNDNDAPIVQKILDEIDSLLEDPVWFKH